ncbi:MAG TPA: hypothetical protein VN814_14195 [Caulobacteraceae bacterium]|nr:hypothetical protein [Caulobacteraceae bacterium]
MSLGLSLGRFNPEAFPVLTPDTVGWGGLGGSNAFMITDAGVTFIEARSWTLAARGALSPNDERGRLPGESQRCPHARGGRARL